MAAAALAADAGLRLHDAGSALGIAPAAARSPAFELRLIDGGATPARVQLSGVAMTEAGTHLAARIAGALHVAGLSDLWLDTALASSVGARLGAYGDARDMVPLPELWTDDGAAVRYLDLSRDPAEAPSYHAALAACTPPAPLQERVRAADTALVALLGSVVADGGLAERCGVRRVGSIGSTARGTFLTPVDFDLIVETDTPVTVEDASGVVTALGNAALHLPEISVLKEEWWPGAPDRLVTVSLGLRGPAILVARLHLLESTGTPAPQPLLDITFMQATRSLDYQLWMRDYLEGLGPVLGPRLCAEVRLFKRLLGEVGEVYGSSEIGLRPITIEQLIVQAVAKRATGCAFGTCDAVLRLIAAEAQASATDDKPFARFKRDHPVRRPARDGRPGWDNASGPVNLLDLLANGDAALAERKWARISALASQYAEYRRMDTPWDIETLVHAARSSL